MLNTIQAGMSVYTLYNASIAIPKLQQYEEKSKTAAKWSTTAADQLHQTRTTQTAGAIAGVLSAGSSISMLFGIISPGIKSLLLTALTGVSCGAASIFMGGFWDEKTKVFPFGNFNVYIKLTNFEVPLMTDYNDAIRSSQSIRGQLALLGLLWGISVFFEILHIL